MDITRICALISNIPPGRNPDLYAEPARVLYKRDGRATGWMRPNVYFDGNPMNLSGPLDKEWASRYVSTPFPGIYELVLCDKAGVPLNLELRAKYFEWVKSTYSIDLAKEYAEVHQEAAPEAPASSGQGDVPTVQTHQEDSAPHASESTAAETAPPATDNSAEPGKRKRR